jgi:hypothetical protein
MKRLTLAKNWSDEAFNASSHHFITSAAQLWSDGTADVDDVVYVNIETWSMGCFVVGEVAKGEQLIANQGQEWMGICATSKKAGSLSM